FADCMALYFVHDAFFHGRGLVHPRTRSVYSQFSVAGLTHATLYGICHGCLFRFPGIARILGVYCRSVHLDRDLQFAKRQRLASPVDGYRGLAGNSAECRLLPLDAATYVLWDDPVPGRGGLEQAVDRSPTP